MSQQRVHVPDASLPSPGSARALVPPLPRYYRGTATSCRPSRRTSFPSSGWYHGSTGSFRVSRRRRARQRRAWGCSPGIPLRVILPWRRQDLPSSWGTPIPVCPCSPTPAGRCVPDRLRNARVAPAKGTTKAPTTKIFRGSIAWLSGWPPMYHDVGYPSPRKARSQVLVRLSWAGFHPQGSCKRFSTHSMFVGLLFQASWHNPLAFPHPCHIIIIGSGAMENLNAARLAS